MHLVKQIFKMCHNPEKLLHKKKEKRNYEETEIIDSQYHTKRIKYVSPDLTISKLISE